MSTASTAAGAAGGAELYENPRAVDEYLQMHFAKEADVFPYGTGAKDGLNFPERCADEVVAALKQSSQRAPAGLAALDVGCAVGGATFALANRGFARVDGVDFSRAFVAAANAMRKDGALPYRTLVEGARAEPRVATPPTPTGVAPTFAWGDACDLEARRDAGALSADGYDAVLGSNLLCRLPRPRAFLRSCARWLVKPGGVLVLLTPFSWLEQWTPKEEWIGGGGAASFEVLAKEMEGLGFRLVSERDVPFLIREHARKFQYGVSQSSSWVREA